MLILSGDIGGTNTRIQLTKLDAANNLHSLDLMRYPNNEHHDFMDIIDAFLATTKIDIAAINAVCIGMAGPVIEGKVRLTNTTPWIISTKDLKNKFNIDEVAIINDFVAIGYGLDTLQTNELATLQVGKPQSNTIKAYLGAGTGLGVGLVTYCEDKPHVHSTEGGHIDFAPTNTTQVKLLHHLRDEYHRVSLERVLSGQGLTDIYRFVRHNKMFGEHENPELHFLIEGSKKIDVAATISEFATKYKDIMAMRALHIFISVYGAAAGNLALTTLPYGGLYLAGGIAPKLITQIQEGAFLEAYRDKGRMSHLIKNIPLHVILCTDVGLRGATIYAKNLLLHKK